MTAEESELLRALEHFTYIFSHDIDTVQKFFTETLTSYDHQIDSILEDIHDREENGPEFSKREQESLRSRLISLYRQMELLYSYLHTNRIAVRQIREKFDEAFPQSDSIYTRKVHQSASRNAFDSSKIKQVMERTEVSNHLFSRVNAARICLQVFLLEMIIKVLFMLLENPTQSISILTHSSLHLILELYLLVSSCLLSCGRLILLLLISQ